MTQDSTIHLIFTITPDREGWQRYLAEYPGFKDESIIDTLMREAIAQWEWEGLIANAECIEVVVSDA